MKTAEQSTPDAASAPRTTLTEARAVQIVRAYVQANDERRHKAEVTVKPRDAEERRDWEDDLKFELALAQGRAAEFDQEQHLAALKGTPIMSMLRWLVDTSSVADVVLINNIKIPADVIFQRELAYLGARMGERLKLGIVVAQSSAGCAWNGPRTHFSEELLRLWAPDFAEREVFVCGPAGYMEFVRATLARIGLPMARYHGESFGAPALAMVAAVAPPALSPLPLPIPPPAPAVASEPVELVFSKSGKTVEAMSGDFLLDVAEDNGVEIESGCRAGNCGTCKTLKTAGDVVMDDQTALSAADIEDGYVLACVGRVYGKRVTVAAR